MADPRSAVSYRKAEPQATPAAELAQSRASLRRSRMLVLAAAVVAIILLAILIFGVYALLQPDVPADRLRDIFIIFVALESVVVGIALIILLVQLATLINLIQNEIRPILSATSETVNTLRGTAQFLGESVVEPVIKLNGYMASMRRVLELMGIKQK